MLAIRLADRSYEISASSAGALNRALVRAGPRHQGRAAHALTDWRIRWSYVPVRSGGACLCGEPTVELELVTTLPRWKEALHAPEGLVRDWSLFIGRLRMHEAVHQDLAVQNGKDLLELLGSLTASDCEALGTEARLAAAAVARRYQGRHASFDLSTRYGLAPEGAQGDGG